MNRAEIESKALFEAYREAHRAPAELSERVWARVQARAASGELGPELGPEPGPAADLGASAVGPVVETGWTASSAAPWAFAATLGVAGITALALWLLPAAPAPEAGTAQGRAVVSAESEGPVTGAAVRDEVPDHARALTPASPEAGPEAAPLAAPPSGADAALELDRANPPTGPETGGRGGTHRSLGAGPRREVRERGDSPAPEAESEPEEAVATAPDLGPEVALMVEARAAMKAAQHTQALGLLDRHAREFPRGVFAQERELSRVTTLCAMGEVDAAVVVGQRYRKRHPSAAERLSKTCVGAAR